MCACNEYTMSTSIYECVYTFFSLELTENSIRRCFAFFFFTPLILYTNACASIGICCMLRKIWMSDMNNNLTKIIHFWPDVAHDGFRVGWGYFYLFIYSSTFPILFSLSLTVSLSLSLSQWLIPINTQMTTKQVEYFSGFQCYFWNQHFWLCSSTKLSPPLKLQSFDLSVLGFKIILLLRYWNVMNFVLLTLNKIKCFWVPFLFI